MFSNPWHETIHFFLREWCAELARIVPYPLAWEVIYVSGKGSYAVLRPQCPHYPPNYQRTVDYGLAGLVAPSDFYRWYLPCKEPLKIVTKDNSNYLSRNRAYVNAQVARLVYDAMVLL